ncbi:MAG: hypothetical protein ACFE0I_19025 [Elainellaceae cyanobacterium]
MILRFCAAVLSRLFSSNQQTRRAWQWWHQRQVDRLHDGAELIRDGLLQELFAMRRNLELACDEQKPISNEHLQQLEAFHRMLEQVSNELSPAYIRDSLPLALQYILQTWGDRHPDIQQSVQLPSSWMDDEDDVQRIVVTAFEELLNLLSPYLQPEAVLRIALVPSNHSATLTVQVEQRDMQQVMSILDAEELVYLRQAFEMLTAGRWFQSVETSCIQWQWVWRINEVANDEVANNKGRSQ